MSCSLPGLAPRGVGQCRDGWDADDFDSERAASKLQLTSDLCDLTVPVAALSWIAFDDGVVGLAGTVSSLIGVYSQWVKTA